METVVIVGASSSIGRAISSRFSAAERVITTYSSRMPEDSDEHTFHLDLREDVSIERFVRTTQENLFADRCCYFLAGDTARQGFERVFV